MTKLVIGKDINSTPHTGIDFSDTGYAASMSSGTSLTLPVPAGMNKAYIQIQGGATVLVAKEAISGVPGSTFESVTWDINPAMRIGIEPEVDSLYFYAVDAAIVKVSFYES